MTSSFEPYLQQALSKYRNPDITRRDVLATVQHYRGLVPKMNSFVFNDGSQRDLLNLDGTIPVQYKGHTYNIPVVIWLLDNHPYSAPMCYVKPTNGMQIKVSKHVDHNGKVYLPYLHDWKQESSDLLSVIQVMIVVFSEQPPVYSKPRHHQDTHSAYAATNPAVAMPQQMHSVYSSGTGSSAPSSHYGYGPVAYPQAASNYPAYPPPNSNPGYASSSNPAYASSSNPAYASTASNPAYASTNSNPGYPMYPPSSGVAYASSNSPYASSTNPYTSYTPQQQAAVTTSTNAGSLSEEHIRASLLSAVDDKMRRRLREIVAQVQAEMDVLKRTQDDLNRGKMKLEELVNKLDHEQGELDRSIVMLREKNETMREIISKLQSQDELDIDEAVVTTAPLYRQLLNSFAEENATEDAIYYLSEALRKGVVDLDVFQKHVRELSRKQFMLRALMLKCREKAKLPC